MPSHSGADMVGRALAVSYKRNEKCESEACRMSFASVLLKDTQVRSEKQRCPSAALTYRYVSIRSSPKAGEIAVRCRIWQQSLL